MHRFYCPTSNFSQKNIQITDKDELHHLRDVLRLKKNDTISLFDGKGGEASGKLLSVTPKQADVRIQTAKQTKHKKPLIILACALPKKTKFEFIIEKATELGVDEIIPLKTRRTEINLKGDRLDKKHLRYKTIAINASKQSCRSIIPAIHPITELSSALDHLTKTTTVIIPSLTGKRKNIFGTFKEIKSPKAISFLIGPEGDFTPKEYKLAQEAGCIPVTLGETVLKVETAALCAVSCAHLFFHA